MHLADGIIQSLNASCSAFRLYIILISMCVPWELNPQPFALLVLTQCSTTEPQEHFHFTNITEVVFFQLVQF